MIVGALNFTESLHDSKTLEASLEQHHRLTGIDAKEVYVDRGYPLIVPQSLLKVTLWNNYQNGATSACDILLKL